MMDEFREGYFNWMYDMVCTDDAKGDYAFDKLLLKLYSIEFIWLPHIPRDENRAFDGIELRRRYLIDSDLDPDFVRFLDGPCSVLEMIIALALRCEEDITYDPKVGDRTAYWFWKMMTNLGLGGMFNENYDENEIDIIVHRFMYRKYDEDGKGGLFRLRHSNKNMQTAEIWYQMNWYLNEILGYTDY